MTQAAEPDTTGDDPRGRRGLLSTGRRFDVFLAREL